MACEGANHTFPNPGATVLGKHYERPLAHDADADKKSWEGMKMFLHTSFTTDRC